MESWQGSGFRNRGTEASSISGGTISSTSPSLDALPSAGPALYRQRGRCCWGPRQSPGLWAPPDSFTGARYASTMAAGPCLPQFRQFPTTAWRVCSMPPPVATLFIWCLSLPCLERRAGSWLWPHWGLQYFFSPLFWLPFLHGFVYGE